MNDVINAISILGFPVFMALLESWYIVKRADETNKIIEENTKAILLLNEKLDIENERND